MTNATNNQTASNQDKNEAVLSKAQQTEVDNLPTKSAKIRYLTALEWTRSQIAKFLGIRYQHVRNVQITPVKKVAAK